MKSASFNDPCRVCGATIPDNGGSLDYRCDECVAAGRTEPKPPQGRVVPFPVRKESTVKFNPFYFGTKTIKGAVQLVKRMLPGSPEEIVTPEELAAIRRQSLAQRIENKRISAEELADHSRSYPEDFPARPMSAPVTLTPSQEGFRPTR